MINFRIHVEKKPVNLETTVILYENSSTQNGNFEMPVYFLKWKEGYTVTKPEIR
jgi:hypothetical protein